MKKVLIAIIVAIVVVIGAAAIAPKDFKIEKSITINLPVEQIFPYLKLIKNSDQWQPWSKMDPNMKKYFIGVDGTVGATASWSGNSEVGIGEQEIRAISENNRIDLELRFKKPMQVTNHVYYVTESLSEKETKVTWTMEGRTPFPFNLMCLLMRGKVEKNFEEGLSELKNILEKMPAIPTNPEVVTSEVKEEVDVK